MTQAINKKLWLILSILLFLLIIQRGFIYLEGRPGRGLSGGVSFAAVTPESVSSIVVEKTDGNIELKRDYQTGWQANGKLADGQRVQSFLEQLQTVQAREVVSRNPDNFGQFGLAEGAVKFTLNRAGQSEVFLIGDAAKSGIGFFLRKDGDSVIYLMNGPVRSQILEGENFWRDKKIVAISPEAIESVAVNSAGHSFEILKAEDKWIRSDKPESENEVEASKMTAFFNLLNPLEAQTFATADQQLSFEEAAEKSSLLIKTGQAEFSFSLAEANGRFWGSYQSQPEVFSLSQSIAKTLLFMEE